MDEFVAYIIKNLVAVPEAVSVTSSEGETELRIEVRVAQEDVGKVIGRRGNTINALRVIVRTVATRVGKKVQLELIQEEGAREARKEAVVEAEPEAEAQVETPPPAEEEVASEESPTAESQEPALA